MDSHRQLLEISRRLRSSPQPFIPPDTDLVAVRQLLDDRTEQFQQSLELSSLRERAVADFMSQMAKCDSDLGQQLAEQASLSFWMQLRPFILKHPPFTKYGEG